MKIGRLASIAAMVCLVGYLLAGPGFRMLLRSEFEQSLPLSLHRYSLPAYHSRG